MNKVTAAAAPAAAKPAASKALNELVLSSGAVATSNIAGNFAWFKNKLDNLFHYT